MIRRDFLKKISLFGVTGTVSYLLNTNQIQAGIKELKGEVEINGKEFKLDSKNVRIPSNSIIKTFSNSSLIFVIGKDAFLLHNNTHIELQPDNKEIEISGFNLKTGSILSVFKPKKRSLRTVHANIGVRGTGLYLECDSDKSYICTCYGTVDISILKMPDVTETVTTQHHDEPRYIHSGKKEIENAPVINHTDKELIMLEKLVGRIPPFAKPGQPKKKIYGL
jgi:hypothetical protein